MCEKAARAIFCSNALATTPRQVDRSADGGRVRAAVYCGSMMCSVLFYSVLFCFFFLHVQLYRHGMMYQLHHTSACLTLTLRKRFFLLQPRNSLVAWGWPSSSSQNTLIFFGLPCFHPMYHLHSSCSFSLLLILIVATQIRGHVFSRLFRPQLRYVPAILNTKIVQHFFPRPIRVELCLLTLKYYALLDSWCLLINSRSIRIIEPHDINSPFNIRGLPLS